MRIMPTLRPTRPRLMFFSVPDNDWPGVIARCLTNATQASVLQSSNG
jgi:hypothetical protein